MITTEDLLEEIVGEIRDEYDNDETEAIEILINHQTKALPEVSEIVGAIINSKKNKIDHKIFYPEL